MVQKVCFLENTKKAESILSIRTLYENREFAALQNDLFTLSIFQR